MKDREQIYFKNRTELRSWLKSNAESHDPIWLVYDRSVNGVRPLSYDDIVEEALCFGWIDSIAKTLDETHSMIYLSKRKDKSVWSKPNKERVKKLIANGQMTDLGLKAIKISKQNGGWEALNDVDNLKMPTELTKAFKKSKNALANFEKFSNSVKKQIYYWVYSAKTEETVSKRVKTIVDMASKNLRARYDKE